MEKMPHDDAACSCLAAALHQLLILGKRRPSPLCVSVSWKGQTALLCLCLGCTHWRMEKMPHGGALVVTAMATAEFAWWAPLQLRMLVAVCPISELICKGRPDICTQDINGLGRWSCCSELWIQYDLPFFTTRHTTTSSPRPTAVSSLDSVMRE
jgi:hypothetical protein